MQALAGKKAKDNAAAKPERSAPGLISLRTSRLVVEKVKAAIVANSRHQSRFGFPLEENLSEFPDSVKTI